MTIRAQRLADEIEISVSDTGIGISEADRGRLFEAFRQIDTPGASRQQGTGLGLALTKRFVELHGGKIDFVSEVGKGSVFTLGLPLGHPAPAAQGLAHQPLAGAPQVHR